MVRPDRTGDELKFTPTRDLKDTAPEVEIGVEVALKLLTLKSIFEDEVEMRTDLPVPRV
jgi:hypothetical protein